MVALKKKYSPTKEKLLMMEVKCMELRCNDPIGLANFPCSKCRISSEYEKMSGVRIEKLYCANLCEV